MKKWKVICGIVLIFLLGVATGALATHRAYQRGIAQFTERGPSGARYAIVRMLTRRLDLTTAQQ
jgi:hypothetical protein